MLNMSKTAKYGLQGLLYLARNRERGFIKIDEISTKEHIPPNYLRKIFQQLIKTRVVESGVGPKGGVKLASDAQQFSLARVINVFDGEPTLSECSLFGTKTCPKLEKCPLHSECHSYDQKIWKKLETFKIDDLI